MITRRMKGLILSMKSLIIKATLKSFWIKVGRLLKIIFSWRVCFILYILFWVNYNQHPFNFEAPNNILIVAAFYYLLFAIFINTFRLIRKISRFYSIPLSIIGIFAVLGVLYFTSPDLNAHVSVENYFRYFYSLALPIGTALIFNILGSIPALFRLFGRKPQYFMFSFFLFIFLVYISLTEYRFYRQLDGYNKFFCSYQKTKDTISPKVVRIIGTYSEGSGFFINGNTVVTNRHVIEGEDYPKVVLPSGEFLTPIKVELSTSLDIAFITTDRSEPAYVVNVGETKLAPGEEALSFGYALGSEIKGSPTILPIRFESNRSMPLDITEYLQFSSTLVEGMSGGPVFDKCGGFVGVNTMSTSGTSLIVSGDTLDMATYLSKEEPKKIKLEPGVTPEDSVFAYYYLLKARDTKGSYGLLSSYYKTKSSYEEWTARFPNVISVEIYNVEEIKPNLVYVLFRMSEWVEGEQRTYVYEGTWETVKEGVAYHLNKSHIVELQDPDDLNGPDYFLNPGVKK